MILSFTALNVQKFNQIFIFFVHTKFIPNMKKEQNNNTCPGLSGEALLEVEAASVDFMA